MELSELFWQTLEHMSNADLLAARARTTDPEVFDAIGCVLLERAYDAEQDERLRDTTESDRAAAVSDALDALDRER